MGTTIAVNAIFSTSMSFGLLFFAIYQVAIEVFPTVTRSAAISLISISGTIGGALGPQLILMETLWKPLHYVLGVLVLLVSFAMAVYVVPETRDKPLPDRFEDIELVLRKKSELVVVPSDC